MLRNVVLVLLSTVVGLVAAEFTLRQFYGGLEARQAAFHVMRSTVHAVDPELGWVPRPGMRAEHPLPYNDTTHLTTNSLGLRGPEIAETRTPGMRRAVVLGDSFAWGWGVNDEDTFPRRLAAEVPGLEVANLGVIGYGTRQERLYYARLGARLRPDVVVLAFCANDVVATSEDFVARGRMEHDQATREARAPRPGGLRGLALYRLAMNAADSNRWMARLVVAVGLRKELEGYADLDDNLRPFLRAYPPSLRGQWDAELAELLRLRDDVRAGGATLVIAVVPELQSVEPRALDASLAASRYRPTDFDMDRLYTALGDFAQANGIAFVNPVAAFRAAAAHGERLYLNREMHFDAQGHRLFAEAIAAALRRGT